MNNKLIISGLITVVSLVFLLTEAMILSNKNKTLEKQIIEKNSVITHKDSLITVLSFDCDSNPVDPERLLKLQNLQKFTEEQFSVLQSKLETLHLQYSNQSLDRYKKSESESTDLFVKYERLESAEVEKLEKNDPDAFDKFKTAVFWNEYSYISGGGYRPTLYELERSKGLSQSLKDFFKNVETVNKLEKLEQDACKAKYADLDEKESALEKLETNQLNREYEKLIKEKRLELGL